MKIRDLLEDIQSLLAAGEITEDSEVCLSKDPGGDEDLEYAFLSVTDTFVSNGEIQHNNIPYDKVFVIHTHF